jgi:hypothetical protein
MDGLFEHLPGIISAAAQSVLGLFALLSVALAVLAYFFFARARVEVRIGVFVLLFVGVAAFGVAVFRASGAGAAVAPTAHDEALSKEARALLRGAAVDPSGLVIYEQYGAGVDLHTNGISYLTDKADHEAVANWEAALQELVKAGYLTDRGGHGEVFEITKAGYERAKTK